jgi:hypothetical protein
MSTVSNADSPFSNDLLNQQPMDSSEVFTIDHFKQLLSEKDAEIQRLKEERDKAEKDYVHWHMNALDLQFEIQHLKSSRVRDIEAAWDACTGNVKVFEPWNRDLLRYLSNAKSSYLKPFTADSK